MSGGTRGPSRRFIQTAFRIGPVSLGNFGSKVEWLFMANLSLAAVFRKFRQYQGPMGVRPDDKKNCFVPDTLPWPHGPSSRPKPGLFVRPHGCFDIRSAACDDPNNSSAGQRFHNAGTLLLDCSRVRLLPPKPLKAYRLRFEWAVFRVRFEWNPPRQTGPKNFFALKFVRLVSHIVKNCRLDVKKALAELFLPAPPPMAVLAFPFFLLQKIELTRIVMLLLTSGPIFVCDPLGGAEA